MTNRQWLLEQMQNMSDEELTHGIYDSNIITNVLWCENINMNERCESFAKCVNCVSDWLKSEHKEQIKLSDAERVILENIDKEFKWICRDKIGHLKVCKDKPEKECVTWVMHHGYFYLSPFNHLFQFIKWNDSEPYNIEELLK